MAPRPAVMMYSGPGAAAIFAWERPPFAISRFFAPSLARVQTARPPRVAEAGLGGGRGGSQRGASAGPGGGDIVAAMLPDDTPPTLPQIPLRERAATVRRLLVAQSSAGGVRAQKVAFLLAALGCHYAANRRFLLRSLAGCNRAEIAHSCSDFTGQLVILLFQEGHSELLGSILSSGVRSYDAALSEQIGTFAGGVLAQRPREFLAAAGRPPGPGLTLACQLAAKGDGGGMDPKEFKLAAARLRSVGGAAALRCLRAMKRVPQDD